MVKDDQSTFISQHYLWAVGLPSADFPPGTLCGDRYRVVESQIISDTQIFKFPDIPEEVAPYVAAYLRLARFPLHIPSPYGIMKTGALEFLLLDKAPISPEGNLYPNFRDSWIDASAMRQINLFWQVLHLWEPLAEFGMVSTLLDYDILRVFGPWVRILELVVDGEEKSSLTDLGDLWIDWLEFAKPEIRDALADFCFGLSRGELNVGDAVAILDNLLASQAASLPIGIKIASATDVGLRRDHNEDNCYPAPDRQLRSQQSKLLSDRLVIICDGLGGHEGGEIASAMAIKTIEAELEIVFADIEAGNFNFTPQQFSQKLDQIVRKANDQIVTLNDQHQKQAQQRMGTTVVMAVMPHPYEVYIVNIGDSRMYWVHSESCDQVTVDDDVATRDVIFAYSFPAYAAQRVDGGSLIQALGTRSSEALYPRIQRLLLDEDTLLLLCSDGLSDYGRVEEILEVHIRPILTERLPLEKSVYRLIDQANQRNGHDNVTIALMRCQLTSTADSEEDTVPNEAFEEYFNEHFPLEPTLAAEIPVTSNSLDWRWLGVALVLFILGAIAIMQITSGFKPTPDSPPTPPQSPPSN